MRYLLKDKKGLLLTDWLPIERSIPMNFGNALSEGRVIIRNNGKIHTAPIQGGAATISADMLDGECAVTVESAKGNNRWYCEGFVVEVKGGVKVAKGINLRQTVGDLTEAIASLSREFDSIRAEMNELANKVEYTVDGHDLI